MADTIEVTQDDISQAEALQRALAGPRPESVDVCAAWKTIKPWWPWIVKIVGKIPKVGAAIAKALEYLGQFLDTYCK